MKKSNKKGFTLAEVLVTLVVIGVVAALSIPALLQNTNQAEMKTGLKKSISVLNNALLMTVAQDGVNAASYTNATGETTPTGLISVFAPKLNVISTSGDSFTTADGMQYTFYKNGAGACGSDATTVIATAKCYVLIDVNGLKNPNLVSDTTTYRDQYYAIIKANSVIPATDGNSVAVNALSGQ